MTTVVSVAQGGTGSNSAALARTALGVPPSAAYDQANTARDQANTARTQANSAYAQANSAYSDANTRLSASGGTLAGDLIITGNLTVSGNSTTLNAEILTIEDADVVLLSNVASTPALNAGIIVNRGTSTNTFLRWDEVTDKWGWSDDGSTTYKFNSALDAYAQANSAYGAANNAVLKAGDTMTGQLNISAGGLLVTGNANFDSATLFVDSVNDRIGIGTTSPGSKLDVNGDIHASNEIYLDNGKYLRFTRSSGGLSIQTLGIESNTDSVRLVTSGDFNIVNGSLTNLMTVKNGGNVGIGTSNAQVPLHVNRSGSSGSQTIVLGLSSVSLRPIIQFSEGTDVNSGTGMAIEYDGRGSGGTNAIRFNSVDNVPVQTFMSNGWVGFGNTSPTAPLLIQHTNLPGEPYSGIIIKNTDTTGAAFTGVTADGVLQSHYRFALNGSTKWQWRTGAGAAIDDLRAYSFTLGSDVMYMTAAGNVGIGINPGNFNGLSFGDSILDVNGAVQIRGDATNGIAIINMGGDTYRKGAIYTPVGNSDPYMALAVGSSGSSSSSQERIRILSNGNVGIGTTDPSTKLHVNGGALIEGNLSLNNNVFSNFELLGYENNFIRPPSDGYGGFRFKTFDGSQAGFLLLRDTTDVDVYQQYGVTLVTDRGPVTLAARGETIGNNSDRNFIRFMTAGGGSAQVRMTINKNGQVTMPSQPRFYAYGNVGGTHASGSFVRYGYTYVNVGSHYSSTNGRFTAPVTGDYYFFWGSIGAAASDVYRFYLYKNGADTGVQLRIDTQATGSEYGTNGSRAIILNLAQNDYVQIYYTADAGTSFYPASDESSPAFTHFGGYLLG